METETIPVKAPVEEQAPIVSRKKKTKKPAEGPAPKRTVTSSSTPEISRPTSPRPEEKVKVAELAKPAEDEQKDTVQSKEPTESLQETPLPPEPATSEAEPSTTAGAEKDKEKPIAPAAILQALEATQQLALSTLSLLKPLTETKGRNWLVDQSSSASSGASSGSLSFTTADLHNHLDQLAFEISRAEAELLKQGENLRRDTGDGRVSGRNLVTSDGLRFSCLSQQEEERVIALTQALSRSKGSARWRPSRGLKTIAMTKVKVEGSGGTPPLRRSPSGAAKPSSSSKRDDIAAYANAFIPPSSDFLLPNTSTGLLKPTNAAPPAAAAAAPSGKSVMTTEAYQRAEAVLENVTRQIEMGVRAAQGMDPNEAIGELASKVNAGIERAIGLYGGLHSGPGGILEGLRSAASGLPGGAASVTAAGEVVPGREQKVSAKEAEQMLAEARKAAEVWERKVNAMVRRNRKMVFGGRE